VYRKVGPDLYKPDGVLVVGDSVGGKTAIVERMLAALDVGYAALAAYIPATGGYTRASRVGVVPPGSDLESERSVRCRCLARPQANTS
jgi:hypothetical protein